MEFFEKRIRPALVQHCYECHGATGKLRGGLGLETRAGWTQGGDSGPAIEPGKPDDSLLIKAIRYEDADLQMPPKGKLPQEVIADFVAWVARGAADPRTESAPVAQEVGFESGQGFDVDRARQFWAYRLPIEIPPPAVKATDWPAGEIDQFLLARLEQAGLQPVADADPATLIRRLSFDLIGLPPTPQETEAFVADPAPEAYARLVERLLASPHFGERWGRHWLDVARYGESVTLRGFVFPEAWRYRDYVIETFNQDRPYDRFMQEQVAGDLLPAASLAERRRQSIGTAFLALGNTVLEDQDKAQLRMDVVDEQLDTLGKALLAQTIGCARCHDHKFDPIPTRDYYALAGILRSTRALEHANVSKWLEFPLPVEPEQEAMFAAREAAVSALQARVKAAQEQLAALTKGTGAAAVLAAADLPGIVIDDAQARAVGEWKLSQYSGRYIGAGYLHDLDANKGEKTLTFLPELPHAGKYEVRLAYSPGTNRSPDVPVTIMSADGETTVRLNQREQPPIDGRFISLGQFRFELNGQGFVIVSNLGTQGHVIADAVQFLPQNAADGQAVAAGAAEPKPELSDTAAKEIAAQTELVKQLAAELKTLSSAEPKRPMFMSVEEEKEIGDTQIHIRGNVHNLGPAAPRGFLTVATHGPALAIPADQSGRKELGAWLARPDNPLPARVMVNRVWHWLFGAGLVRTTDNFGAAGEAPSHPELLDLLAVRFMEQGWSVKQVVREIVLSRAYRLSTVSDAAGIAADPENRLLWRMNRRRLDAECIRDAMLCAGGNLEREMGGPTIRPGVEADYGYQHTDARRSVYAPVFRNALPDLFEAFDFPNPSLVTGRRDTSTVAPQALFLMNHPFVSQQAQLAADRLLAEENLDEPSRVTRAFRLTLGRDSTPEERTVADKHLSSSVTADAPADARTVWGELFQALFSALDFRYLN